MTDATNDRRSSRTSTWVDSYIGRRIRQRRLEMGKSQEKLAAEVGLTYQQIQKFEVGYNRVAASRLADIAAVLKASPGDFFPPTNEAAPQLRRGDLTQAMDAIAEIIARHEESIAELRRIHRRFSSLALQETGDGAHNGKRGADDNGL